MQRQVDYHYLSDEELNALIVGVEEADLLQAPVHLKEQILSQAAAYESGKARKTKRIKLFSYSAKVVFATAAALVMLFLLPEESDMVQKTMVDKPGVVRNITQQWNTKSNEFVSKLNQFSFQFQNKEDK